jgi:hypothetical protein
VALEPGLERIDTFVVEERMLTEVKEGERTIGTGTRERRVIEVDEHRRSAGTG